VPETKNAADAALNRLLEGNARYAADVRSLDSLLSHRRKAELAQERQQPFAIILGCSDSRVPAEVVFDQGLGDLFVIRIAGNIVAPSHVGSVEFAASRFGTRLVLVMGHTRCSAVEAAPEAGPAESANQESIVGRIRRAIGALVEPKAGGDPAAEALRLKQAVRVNVRASVEALRHGSGDAGGTRPVRRLAHRRRGLLLGFRSGGVVGLAQRGHL
jgi:carbonic anhydrase